jgi:hypothetical protein
MDPAVSDAVLTYLDPMKRFAALADVVQREAEAPADWTAVGRFASSVEPYLKEIHQEVGCLVANMKRN